MLSAVQGDAHLALQALGEHLHCLYNQGQHEFLLLESLRLPFLTCMLPAPCGYWQLWSRPCTGLAQRGPDAS